jgi:hypothetical protein
MITFFFLLAISIRALFLKDDRVNLLFFAGICSILLIFGNSLPKENFSMYYWFCGLFDLLVISVIVQDKRITTSSTFLICLSLGFIYLNLFGFATYEGYISHSYYTLSCLLLYSSLLLFTFRKWVYRGSILARNYWSDSIFRSYYLHSSLQRKTSEKEKRT